MRAPDELETAKGKMYKNVTHILFAMNCDLYTDNYYL